ncbi:hypothetical protein I312_104194 [Cryptococcus bacillisporus CA1280]|uniref:Uncharacterized protein n=2 Tax=Cryptococcus gattii TaxID=552467 RepID=A0A0D0VI08_CRYGA|nr:hypothetical protein I312_03932 [Cryptococcus bacillisporus CA1280]KIR60258.1 hypothetical protein I314_04114 [Cryptococcus bacillisporus CA1873]|eukprot:KIR60258.1 hypothetical protein I314_04114 [Cryptococcus gattii CA1873]
MTRPHAHSTSASQPYQPKPPRLLHRSPSEPVHVNGPLAGSNGVNGVNGENGALTSPSQQIYVLTADGSRLFLLDPTRPNGEEPPPYASFPIQHIPDSDADADAEADVEGNGYVGGIGDTLAPTSSRLLTPGYIPTSTSPIVEPSRRHRARTLSALSAERSRPRTSTTTSRPDNRRARTGLLTTTASPGPPYGRGVAVGPADERTPLLAVRVGDGMAEADEAVEGQGDGSLERRSGMRRGWWRGVCCGELEKGEQVGTWSDGWKRFWRPVGKKDYWASVFHLIFLNFPLALLVWPPLLVGTLAGTALLITLPIGAAVWWITLFIARSAARLETIMQTYYHPLPPSKLPPYHPIFHIPLAPSPLPTPLHSPTSSPSRPHSHLHSRHSANSNQSLHDEENPTTPTPTQQWDKRFTKCSYAMFLDHYSYSSLSYFLLIKPVITLFSTIVIVVVLLLGGATVVGLPVALRAVKRWGKWQAEVAMENL